LKLLDSQRVQVWYVKTEWSIFKISLPLVEEGKSGPSSCKKKDQALVHFSVINSVQHLLFG